MESKLSKFLQEKQIVYHYELFNFLKTQYLFETHAINQNTYLIESTPWSPEAQKVHVCNGMICNISEPLIKPVWIRPLRKQLEYVRQSLQEFPLDLSKWNMYDISLLVEVIVFYDSEICQWIFLSDQMIQRSLWDPIVPHLNHRCTYRFYLKHAQSNPLYQGFQHVIYLFSVFSRDTGQTQYTTRLPHTERLCPNVVPNKYEFVKMMSNNQGVYELLIHDEHHEQEWSFQNKMYCKLVDDCRAMRSSNPFIRYLLYRQWCPDMQALYESFFVVDRLRFASIRRTFSDLCNYILQQYIHRFVNKLPPNQNCMDSILLNRVLFELHRFYLMTNHVIRQLDVEEFLLYAMDSVEVAEMLKNKVTHIQPNPEQE